MHSVYSIYGYAGDAVHFIAVLIFIAHILYRKSCQGLSGRMQILYAMVVSTRYLDLFKHYTPVYAGTGVCFTLASYFTCYLMYGKYGKTLEREFDSFWIETCIISSVALAFLYVDDISNPINVFWTFSRYLEATVVIPQMYFDCKSYNDVNRVAFLYVFLLNGYRGLYIYHWVRTDQWNRFLAYPAIAQISIGVLYHFIVCVFPSHRFIPEIDSVGRNDDLARKPERISVVSRGSFPRQLSLLETPFLMRSQTSSTSLNRLAERGSDSEPSPDFLRRPSLSKAQSLSPTGRGTSSSDVKMFEGRQRF